jgi:hypothetical protein
MANDYLEICSYPNCPNVFTMVLMNLSKRAQAARWKEQREGPRGRRAAGARGPRAADVRLLMASRAITTMFILTITKQTMVH